MSDVAAVHRELWGRVRHHWTPNAVFGHGEDHAHRTHRQAVALAAREQADATAAGAACYLMDAGLERRRGRAGHVERSLIIAEELCEQMDGLRPHRALILAAVAHHEAECDPPADAPAEVWIVRDSDTLDRLGYTGIRMTLAYGVWAGRPLCHPHDPLCLEREPDLDGYTLDYVRHLATLLPRLRTDGAIAAAERKAGELEEYLALLASRDDDPATWTYAMSRAIARPRHARATF